MTSFLEQALVFIGSAVILVPIFRWLKFGSVLGYLIAGILVGPYGFKLIEDSHNVIHFAEFGVVLLLFMIGLEIQPRKLWSMRQHLFGLGGMQVLLTTLVLSVLLNFFQIPWLSSFIIGFALSLSSTAFAMQTLTERNQLNTEFGRASFSVLLMQDLVAIPALAIIPILSAKGSGEPISVQKILAIVLIGVFLLVASRFLIRPLFRIIAATRAREIFTAATLLIVLGVAALMQKVGLSSALGAFISGVLLADSEYRHELEANLEPFKGLLMGLFFIGVGMAVQFNLIVEQPGLIISLAVGYLLIKYVIIYFSGIVFNLGRENSNRMAVTISQGGEFAFVIFGMVVTLSLGSSDIINRLTAVITISMALSPVISMAYEKYMQVRQKQFEPRYDEIKNDNAEVIIAGFGRFGQMFGRILRAQNIPFVAIDHNADHIELVRKHGNKVYYGDASRKELLEAAGVEKAKYFILCIDDMDVSVKTAKFLVEEYPHLKIFARARNRGHAFDLMALGITAIKRETLDSSVYFVKDLLTAMGFQPEKALDIVEKFKRHDEIMLVEQFKVRNDDKIFINLSHQSTAQLAQVLNSDSNQSYIDSEKK